MISRALLLLALLCGCSSPGILEILHPAKTGTGYALSTGDVLTIIHPTQIGDTLYSRTRWGDWEECRVIDLGPGGVVIVRPVDWEEGDSGSPLKNKHGEIVAVANGIPAGEVK